MPDMLIRLYEVEEDAALLARLRERGIRVARALAPDRDRILDFVADHAAANWPQESATSWRSECAAALSNNPPTLFLAIGDKAIAGFACYDATAKGFFGPTGVLRDHQGSGIGSALLLRTLVAMREAGYGYAIVGSPARSAMAFYVKCAGATPIEANSRGVYERLVAGS